MTKRGRLGGESDMEFVMKWWMCVSLVVLASGQWVGAQAPKQEDLPGAKEYLSQWVAQLDREVGQRMVRRPDATGPAAGRLEMEIDWRLVTRWMESQAASAPAGSELQIAAHIRADLLRQAALAVENMIDNQQGRVSQSQADAISRLHQLTFVLEDAKEVRQLDVASKKFASLLSAIAGLDESRLPVLRPRPVRASRGPVEREEPGDVPTITNQIQLLNVSVPLRQQLAALAAAAGGQGAENPADAQKLAATRSALSAAVDLARGLNSNVAVAPEARSQIEGQLSESIALFLDPRTRSVGQARLQGMRQYREMANRINRLGLSTTQMQHYGPLFTLAQQDPEAGARAMAALERFLHDRAKFEARGRKANAIPGLQRSTEEIEKQVGAAISSFDAAASGGGADLEARGQDLHRQIALLETLDQMPATLDALAAYKPKPGGALERRAVQAAVAPAGAGAQKADGIKVLEQMRELERVSGELSKLNASEIPRLVDQRYAGGRLAMLEGKWRATIGEMASALAGGGEVDAKKLNQVMGVRSIYDAARRAAQVEAVIVDAPTLARWVDWRMSEEQLRSALRPWQQALSEAVANYLADSLNLAEWNQVDRRFRAFMGMLERAGQLKQQCAAFPEGMTWLAAALATPMDRAAYPVERFASLGLEVWEASGEREALDAVLKKAQGN